MKRLYTLILTLALCLSLAACGNGGNSAKDTAAPQTDITKTAGDDTQALAAPKSFVIGFPEAPVDVPAVKAIKINTEMVAVTAGGVMNNEVYDFTPEGTIDAVEKMIARGVQGVKVTPASDSIIPTILNMCEENQVYFILAMRTISDESVMNLCKDSKYFLGYVYEDDYAAGYALGKALADTGGTTYALVGTSVGDTTGDTRELGLAAAAEEFGLTKVAEVRALAQAADATAAVESFLAAYPDLGGIIRIASTAAGDVNAICAALEESGRAGEVKFVTIDSDAGSEKYFDNGTLTATLGNNTSLDAFITTTILVNAVMGTPVTDMPVNICIPFPLVTTSEELAIEADYIIGEKALYPVEYIQQNFLKYYNADVTIDSILHEIELYSPSYIASLW